MSYFYQACYAYQQQQFFNYYNAYYYNNWGNFIPLENKPIEIQKTQHTIMQIEVSESKILQEKIEQSKIKHSSEQRRPNEKKKLSKKTKQDRNFSYRYQDKDRNIYSNILKSLIIKIREDQIFQRRCTDLLKKMNLSIQLSDLIAFIDKNFEKTKTYISPTYIKKVLKGDGSVQLRKFLRVLLSKYLRQGFKLVLLSSQRIQKESKILQMDKARELWYLIYRQEQV